MKKILIYGIKEQAQQLYELITQEKQGEIDAFVVDDSYKTCDFLLGKPVYGIDCISELFSPQTHDFVVSFAYTNMVRNRREKIELVEKMGYKVATIISKTAHVYTADIEDGVIICPGTVVMPFVKLGKGTFFECGCTIAHHSQIGQYNFFGPGAVVCGDVVTQEHCFLGSASTIANGAKLGSFTFVKAGTLAIGNITSKSVVDDSRKKCQVEMTSDQMMDRFVSLTGGQY